MGISDFYQVVRDAAPDQIITYHLSELEGYRLAIDISVFLYKYIRSAGPERWMNTFILLLCTLKKHGIKAVCIFDGPNPPVEKKEEQDRRRAENQKALNRLSEAIRVRDKLQDEYVPFDDPIGPSLKKEIEGILGGRRGQGNYVNYHDVTDVVDALNVRIEKLERQTLPITDEYRDTAMLIVEMMGLHGIQADGEAETLCAYLAVNGKVDAVLTEDTDVLAYGTPFMLAFKDFKLNEEKVVGLHLPSILEEMEMDVDEFRDLCILLSCDYNSRVRGFPPDGRRRKKAVGIGAKGALCMIQEYRRLEEVCKHVEDPAPLKYRRCRELFTVPKTVKEDLIPYNLKPDYERLEAFIADRKLTIKVPYIAKCYKPATLQFDDETDEELSGDEDDEVEVEDDVEASAEEAEGFEVGGDVADDLAGDLGDLDLSDKDSGSHASTDAEEEPEPELVDDEKVKYAILSAECAHVLDEEESKCLEAHFKFEDEGILEAHEGTLFEDLIEPFNDWLEANGHEGWCVDDVIEIVRFIDAADAIMPYVVTK